MTQVIAFDLGASSGRAIVGILENEKLKLDEIYRFSNKGILINNSLYWDILRIFQKIKQSLSIYVKKYGNNLDSIGIDTWGVDFVLLDENDELVGKVHHYRDNRTNGIFEKIFKVIPRIEMYNQTGIQIMQINTIMQLFSMVEQNSPHLSTAKTFLMLPDYFNFLLSGVKCCEYSEVTTSQLYNPIKKDWAFELIKKLDFNPEWFIKIIQPGTILGYIQKNVTEETGLSKETKVIAPPTHDTGSAVVAVPVDMNKYNSGEWAYLSSGTWSLLGVELNEPIINTKALEYNFTNEGGINHTIRFLKNISGLWLIQECKRIWNKNDQNLSWDQIEQEAKNAQPFQNFFDPGDPVFLNPPDMIETIKKYCKLKNQVLPETIGQISRATFENLVFKYKLVFEQLEELIENKIKILHIIGGGSQNDLLNQFTANILNIPVLAGPSEATAIGNILVQALALGEIKDIKQIRNIVRKSSQITEYTPMESRKWHKAYEEFLNNIK
ncbi:MAG: rhamnulokinase [Promethearchaeota archaeon]|jgi:rhamnulokinase